MVVAVVDAAKDGRGKEVVNAWGWMGHDDVAVGIDGFEVEVVKVKVIGNGRNHVDGVGYSSSWVS